MPNVPQTIIAALPCPCEAVIETHISWVLLAGEVAYKVKKPVTLPFLDYGTRDKRLFYCEEELRINRRFAPGLYLDVVALAGEPALRMRRFPEEARLDHLCRRGAIAAPVLLAFARTLAAILAKAPVVAADGPFGTPAAIMTAADENFSELARLVPAEAARLARLRKWTEEEGMRRQDDFARRKREGRVREGHGDLHLANLVLLDGRIVPFDAIEFSADFRNIDVANEVAFLLLDLVEHGQPGWATAFLSEWLAWSGDFDALRVLRFYLVYRAMVRAKVTALQDDLAKASEYLALAERFTRPAEPALIITFGPSGCGKTYVSGRQLLARPFLDAVRIRSDVERKRLYGLAPDAKSGGTIYTPVANLRTYARLAELAEEAITAGWSAIVDAAFLRRAERQTFRVLAERLGVRFAILAPSATPEEMRRRLLARQNDASEATLAVLEQQLTRVEPLGEDEREAEIMDR